MQEGTIPRNLYLIIIDREKEPVFADCVPESYEELATDMKDFQDRIKLQKPQCSYKDPGKFEHLVQ